MLAGSRWSRDAFIGGPEWEFEPSGNLASSAFAAPAASLFDLGAGDVVYGADGLDSFYFETPISEALGVDFGDAGPFTGFGGCGCSVCGGSGLQEIKGASTPFDSLQSVVEVPAGYVPLEPRAAVPSDRIAALQYSLPSELNVWNTAARPVVVLTYSFENGQTDQFLGRSFSGWAVMTEADKAAIRSALTDFEAFINVDFQEVASGSPDPDLVFGKVSLPSNVGGQANFNYSWRTDGSGNVTERTLDAFAVFRNDDDLSQLSNRNTLLHEIGHTLTLKHPGPYDALGGPPEGPFLPAGEDNNTYTVMSYNPLNGPRSPALMLYDVAALQARWGANPNAGAGNDVYSTSNQTLRTIWDVGGTDTIDGSGQSGAQRIDLVDGAFSTGSGAFPLAIVHGVLIEHATGGFGADVITGNEVRNELHGAAGDDALEGRGGDDFLDGGLGRDTLRGEIGADHVVGGDGDDRQFGQDGDDLMGGGQGADFLEGGGGFDRLYGDGGNDHMVGGTENDALYGGEGDDLLGGGDGDDFIEGGNGADNVFGDGGRDHIIGGALNDRLHGQDGDDLIGGSEGDDFLDGGNGRDRLFGDAGLDHIVGGADGDELHGQDGDDLIGGGDGDDLIEGGADRDRLFGDAGADRLAGGAAGDQLAGQAGDDRLSGDDGDDVLDGGDGADLLYGGLGNDVVDGGEGFDTYFVSGNRSDYNLTQGQGFYTLIGSEGIDTLRNVNLLQFADLALNLLVTVNFVGTTAAEAFTGTEGDDRLDGLAGADTLVGESGNDHITGGADADRLFGVRGDDLIGGQDGDDFIEGGDGFDRLYGDAGQDHMLGGSANDQLFGGDGGDLIGGQDQDDFIDGGRGFDRLYGDAGNDHMVGGSENDQLFGGDGDDLIGGQDANDFIDGGEGFDRLFGDAGDDHIVGGGADDQLSGHDGHDLIGGQDGNDAITGGVGNDRLFGDAGDDRLEGGDGVDTLDGGAGFDTAVFAGRFGDYRMLTDMGVTRVEGPGGVVETFSNIERLEFADGFVGINDVPAITRINGGPEGELLVGTQWIDIINGGGGGDTMRGLGGDDFIAAGPPILVDAPDMLKPTTTSSLQSPIAIPSDAFDIFARDGVANAMTVPHATVYSNTFNSNADFYRFTVPQNATVVLDVDGATFISGQMDLYSTTAFFPTLIASSNGSPLDPGSTSTIDPRIAMELTAGTYIVSVRATSYSATPTYTLHLSVPGVAPARSTAGAILDGGAGEDHLVGNSGVDQIFGGEGADLMGGQGGGDFMDAGGERDRVYGDGGDDHIVAGADVDSVFGGDGNDLVGGQDGDDFIDGGAGLDRLYGDAGRDHMVGGGDRDEIFGGDGDDLIGGQDGDDFVDGGNGADRLYGDAGNDHMVGGIEADLLDGGRGDDLIGGQDGNDLIVGGDGADRLYGDAGDDRLEGGSGADLLDGGAGLDTAVFAGAAATHTIYRQGDAIMVATGGVIRTLRGVEVLQFADGVVNEPDVGTLIQGGAGDETLTGTAGADTINGLGGADVLNGLGGDDILTAGAPRPFTAADIVIPSTTSLSAIASAQRLDGAFDLQPDSTITSSTEIAHATVRRTANSATDYYRFTVTEAMMNAGPVIIDVERAGGTTTYLQILTQYGNAITSEVSGDAYDGNGAQLRHTYSTAGGSYFGPGEYIIQVRGLTAGAAYTLHVSLPNLVLPMNPGSSLNGGDGNDQLLGDIGADRLNGGNGADTLTAGDGADVLLGEAGRDTLAGGLGADILSGGLDADILNGDAGQDDLYGDDGDDQLNGGADNDRLWGQIGNDLMDGGSGWDTLRGGDGADTLTDISGGPGQGANMLYGEHGNDVLNGTGSLYGGIGDDRLTGGGFLYGGDGADVLNGAGRLFGEAGNDIIFSRGGSQVDGGIGADVIHMGPRGDTLIGGAGADRFVLDGVNDVYGTIADFNPGDGDRIDVSAFDVNTAMAGHQTMILPAAGTYQGQYPFPVWTGRAGETFFIHYTAPYTSNPYTLLLIDSDGDRDNDFELKIMGLVDNTNGWVFTSSAAPLADAEAAGVEVHIDPLPAQSDWVV